MKKLSFIVLLTLCCTLCWAQRGDLRKGNRHFAKGEFPEADISYRKALLKDSTDVSAKYNLANTLYREGNLDEAKKLLTYDYEAIKDNPLAPDIFFNLGNIAIAQEDWNAAVAAYIQCLTLNPDDIQAKENYTYARYHIPDPDQNQNGDGDGEGNDNQDQDKDNQNKDQNNQDQQENQGQGGKKPQPVELSPQQAQQLLQAIQEKERETQEKVDKEKAAVLKSRQKEKNW